VEPHSRLLGDRYELLVPLASGGMGRVWRARDVLLERPVAVKVLRNEFTADATFRARFRAEATHTAALHHPHIASVFDYGEVRADGENLAYLVMELVEGETLADLLERKGRLDPARTLDLLRQTSSALAAAHAAGLVHRDIKPGNLLVRDDGVVKITDFGIAWSASSVPLTGTGQVMGTANYLSPEQAAGGPATPASDVYALGAVAYECLTGRRAFDGESSVQVALKQIHEEPAPLPPDIPAGVRRLVERAMVKDPAERYPDGAAFRAAVDATADTGATAPIPPAGRTGTAVLPLPAAPAAAPAATAAPSRRFPRMLGPMLLGALALVLAGVVGALLLIDRDGTGTPPSSGSSAESSSQPSTSAPATPSPISLTAADLVGRPVDEVEAELVGQGLRVELAPVETTDVAAGLVTAATVRGEPAPDSLVTLFYAVEPGGNGNGGGGGGGGGNGNGNGNEGGGNGNGNGGGG
jgi:eukaryotic-like serine/threonine-protein kinase